MRERFGAFGKFFERHSRDILEPMRGALPPRFFEAPSDDATPAALPRALDPSVTVQEWLHNYGVQAMGWVISYDAVPPDPLKTRRCEGDDGDIADSVPASYQVRIATATDNGAATTACVASVVVTCGGVLCDPNVT